MNINESKLSCIFNDASVILNLYYEFNEHVHKESRE